MFDHPLIERAARAYLNWFRRSGFVPQQPSSTSSIRRGNRIELLNVRGLLAVYQVHSVRGKERLARVKEKAT